MKLNHGKAFSFLALFSLTVAVSSCEPHTDSASTIPSTSKSSDAAIMISNAKPSFEVQSVKQVAGLTTWTAWPTLKTQAMTEGTSSNDPTLRNLDFSNFQGTYNGEDILYDADGPGVVNRIWMADFDLNGRVRIYIDRNQTPTVDMKLGKFFSGTKSPFIAPLTGDFRVSSGGFYSYVPIAYAEHILITAKGWKSPDPNDTLGLYYDIGHQTLPRATHVASFKGNENLAPAAAFFQSAGTSPYIDQSATQKVVAELNPGSTLSLFDLRGPLEVATFTVELRPTAFVSPGLEAYQKTRLDIFRDGESRPSFSVPLSYLFGQGHDRPAPVRSLAFGMDASGLGYFYMPMPFSGSLRAQLVNSSSIPLGKVKVRWTTRNPEQGVYPSGSALPLNATFTDAITRVGQNTVLLDVRGVGHLAAVVYDNGITSPAQDHWILEGNELIDIDGQLKIAGTGTEDFFNGAYYFDGGRFSLPTHGFGGLSAMYRIFFSDPIIFSQSIKFRMQHGGSNDRPGSHVRAATFWYGNG